MISFTAFLDRFFSVTERGSTFSREILAGATVFSAMAYILAVNPAIMAQAGLPHGPMVITTIAGAVAGTLIMALWANLPVALAPAMSSNVLFAQVIVIGAHVDPLTGFTCVLFSGLIFTLLSLSNLRSKIISGIPTPIIIGIQFAIGALIARIGFISGGLAEVNSSGIHFGDFSKPPVLLEILAVLLAFLLTIRKLFWGSLAIITVVTILGLFIHDNHDHLITQLPKTLFQLPNYPTEYLFPFNFENFFEHAGILIPITLYALLSDFFDATGTLLTVGKRAGLCGTTQNPELDKRAFTSDGLGSVVGVCLGTCTVSAYVESAIGAETGARTGLSALVVAILFGFAAFFSPLFAAIPALATAPILIVVGVSIMGHSVHEIKEIAPSQALIPFLMLLICAVTGNFMLSLTLGTILFTMVQTVLGKWRSITPILLGLDFAFLCYMYLQTRV